VTSHEKTFPIRNCVSRFHAERDTLRGCFYTQAPRVLCKWQKAIFETQKKTKGTKETKMLAFGENMLF
jgi:hypothetical protein